MLAARQVEMGKAQLDRDPALLFLLQAVGVDAGDRPHQGRLAVVDVAGGAQNDLFQFWKLLMKDML